MTFTMLEHDLFESIYTPTYERALQADHDEISKLLKRFIAGKWPD
jgi:hypothetical protein